MGVVAFKPKTQAEKRRYEQARWINLIHNGLKVKRQQGVRLQDIAAATGLCSATISRFMSDEAKSPHMRTIVKLMRYLKYKLYAEEA